MPAKNLDLHGNVPDSSPVVLLLVDVINDLEFEGGDKLLRPAVKAAARMAALKQKARKRRIPVIYANDNFGRWRSDFKEAVTHCLEDGVRGRAIAELLKPAPEDYFVLKAKHSAFYSTTLPLLLDYLQAKRIVLGGLTADMCVLMTAADAFLRDFELHVPEDCTASISPRAHRGALDYIKRVFHADTRPSTRLDLAKLRRSTRVR
ncbi:MAG TPA: isochorismatase family cysteine hydrolase [Burkholderiales bacterium]|jgi:nicotinamidase-related amidase|nr:isochorismatase family cysteine hydrolase [Burkholderiales bacterium]